MSDPVFNVKLLSPARLLLSTTAKNVVIPATNGELMMLKGHTAMVCEIGVGRLTVGQANGEDIHFFVSGGYADLSANEAKILVDVADLPTEIDRKRAEDALRRASERLIDVKAMNVDIARALYARKRAEWRLKMQSEQSQKH